MEVSLEVFHAVRVSQKLFKHFALEKADMNHLQTWHYFVPWRRGKVKSQLAKTKSVLSQFVQYLDEGF